MNVPNFPTWPDVPADLIVPGKLYVIGDGKLALLSETSVEGNRAGPWDEHNYFDRASRCDDGGEIVFAIGPLLECKDFWESNKWLLFKALLNGSEIYHVVVDISPASSRYDKLPWGDSAGYSLINRIKPLPEE